MSTQPQIQYRPIDMMRMPFPMTDERDRLLFVVLLVPDTIGESVQDRDVEDLKEATWEDAECL